MKNKKSHTHIRRHLQYLVHTLEIANTLMMGQVKLHMEHMERVMIQVQ